VPGGTGIDPAVLAGLVTEPTAGVRDATAPREGMAGVNDDAGARKAAEQFEAMLLRELVSVLRRSAPKGGLLGGGGSGGSSQYLAMFDDAFADHLAAAGGIGIAELVARDMGLPPKHAGTDPGASGLTGTLHTTRAGSLPLYASPRFPVDPEAGSVERLRAAAGELLSAGGDRRFSKDGTLLPRDLASGFATDTPEGGRARFNVNDARGYQGYYKCNLFAFELARRAGYDVPVVGRPHGWGFPGPTSVAEDAADDRRLDAGWARVVTGAGAETLDGALLRGERAFLLTGSGAEGRQGHMAVLERVHRVDYADDGRLRRIVFDGWEARADGARHLVRRTWNLDGAGGGPDPRGGFQRIELLELRRSVSGPGQEVPLGRGAGPSTPREHR